MWLSGILSRVAKNLREKMSKKDPNNTALASKISLFANTRADEILCGMNQQIAMLPSQLRTSFIEALFYCMHLIRFDDVLKCAAGIANNTMSKLVK